MSGSTIAAIATPPGRGGIAVVRLSGLQALAVAAQVFHPANAAKRLQDAPGYTALFGHFYAHGRRCDETVALVFRAPKSYTGEDVVELSCHGGTAVVRTLLDACLEAGAVMAAPGEFTRRAFLNGKLSLTQAEAVMDLVEADSRQAAAAAEAAMAGALWNAVQEMTDRLLTLAGHIAAWTDYPEEDVEALEDASLQQTLQQLEQRLTALISEYDRGAAVRRGVPTAIVGAPNVGKSTLLNLLAGHDRAIVTPVAGTTRDVVEETVQLENVTLLLADTAGLHETADEVEREGIRRSRQRLAAAALVLAVFDASRPLTAPETERAARLAEQAAARPVLFVINKCDLPAVWQPQALPGVQEGVPYVCLSAGDAASRPLAEQAVLQALQLQHFDPDAALLANRRQLECAGRARDAVRAALEARAMGLDLDAVGVCVQDALTALYELTGQNVSDAVVDEVFSRFCVGK